MDEIEARRRLCTAPAKRDRATRSPTVRATLGASSGRRRKRYRQFHVSCAALCCTNAIRGRVARNRDPFVRGERTMNARHAFRYAPQLLAAVLVVSVPGEAEHSTTSPDMVPFPNPTGFAATFSTTGSIHFSNPFFQSPRASVQ